MINLNHCTLIKRLIACREKGAATFAKAKLGSDAILDALSKAIEAGADSAFLQTHAASTLKQFVRENAELSDDRRDVLASLWGAARA